MVERENESQKVAQHGVQHEGEKRDGHGGPRVLQGEKGRHRDPYARHGEKSHAVAQKGVGGVQDRRVAELAVLVEKVAYRNPKGHEPRHRGHDHKQHPSKRP